MWMLRHVKSPVPATDSECLTLWGRGYAVWWPQAEMTSCDALWCISVGGVFCWKCSCAKPAHHGVDVTHCPWSHGAWIASSSLTRSSESPAPPPQPHRPFVPLSLLSLLVSVTFTQNLSLLSRRFRDTNQVGIIFSSVSGTVNFCKEEILTHVWCTRPHFSSQTQQ